MIEAQRDVLDRAVNAFRADNALRNWAKIARHDLAEACREAHEFGVSDAQLARVFGQVPYAEPVYSRARIQQIRTQGEK